MTAMLCYESEPTGVTELNAKWLIMKPFGFFFVSIAGMFSLQSATRLTTWRATTPLVLPQVLCLSDATEATRKEHWS